MTRQTTRALALAALALIGAPRVAAHAQSPTARLVRNANAFLATFEPAQKQRVLFAFDDQKQRVRWSNLPDRMVQRAGLKGTSMNATAYYRIQGPARQRLPWRRSAGSASAPSALPIPLAHSWSPPPTTVRC